MIRGHLASPSSLEVGRADGCLAVAGLQPEIHLPLAENLTFSNKYASAYPMAESRGQSHVLEQFGEFGVGINALAIVELREQLDIKRQCQHAKPIEKFISAVSPESQRPAF
jgi:hypothetical protein